MCLYHKHAIPTPILHSLSPEMWLLSPWRLKQGQAQTLAFVVELSFDCDTDEITFLSVSGFKVVLCCWNFFIFRAEFLQHGFPADIDPEKNLCINPFRICSSILWLLSFRMITFGYSSSEWRTPWWIHWFTGPSMSAKNVASTCQFSQCFKVAIPINLPPNSVQNGHRDRCTRQTNIVLCRF